MTYDKTDDKELVTLSKSGNTEAFDELLIRAIPRTKALLMKRFKQPHLDYDEAIQKASIRAWERIGHFASECAFPTWFFQIAKHILVDELTRGRKMKRITITHSEWAGENDSPEHIRKDAIESTLEETAATILMQKESLAETKKLVEETLAQLGPKHYQVFDLICNQNLSYKEAATICNCSIGTIMSRLFFARKYAQQYIKSTSGRKPELVER